METTRDQDAAYVLARLKARAAACEQKPSSGRRDAIALADLDISALSLGSRQVLPDEQLCGVCKQVDLGTIRGKRDGTDEFLLGYVQDILASKTCSLCRLVTHALSRSWTGPPLFASDGSRIRCHLFIPGPLGGGGRREMVITPLIPDRQRERDGARPLATRTAVRLLDADLSLVQSCPGEDENIVAREILPRCDLGFLGSKYKICSSKHGLRCEWVKLLPTPSGPGDANHLPTLKVTSHARDLRVIDMVQQNIIRAPFQCRFVALSYVWGKIEFLRLTKANRSQLEQEGALSQPQFPLPATVWDAMSVARTLGERYLWVDALCIIQDDDADKETQIRQMDVIYSSAALTLVAAAGTDAHHGIPGVGETPRTPSQHVESIHGLRFATTSLNLLQCLERLCWNTRGWTLQELALSRRVLCFAPTQAYYLCRCGVWGEDSDFEKARPLEAPPQPLPPVFELNMERGLWSCYANMVNQFTTRDFTCETDVIDALDGLFSNIRTAEDEFFVCGLPETLLDTALLWQPQVSLRRRKSHPGGAFFPSWSWAGWVGQAWYPPYLEPDDIHTEISSWKILIPKGPLGRDGESHHLYVDSNYLSGDKKPAERTRFRGLRPGTIPCPGFEDTLPPWRPSLWRAESPAIVRKGLAALRSNTNDGSQQQQTKDGKTRQQQQQQTGSTHLMHSYKNCVDAQQFPRIQTGLLCFSTQMSAFILKGAPVTPLRGVRNPPFCASLPIYCPDPRSRDKKRLVMVGRLMVQGSEVVKLGPLNVAEFIVLSSTSKRMEPAKEMDEDEIPEIYDVGYFKERLASSVQVEEPMFYNVMWINYSPRHSTRRGVGQIYRGGWDMSNSLERHIKLA